MTETKKEPRLMCNEIVVNNFHNFSKRLIEEVPELMALGLVMQWRVGQSDLPCGTIHVRKEHEDQPQVVFGMIEQSRKMLWLLIEATQVSLHNLEEQCKQVVSNLNVAQKTLEEKLAEIEHIKKETQTITIE